MKQKQEKLKTILLTYKVLCETPGLMADVLFELKKRSRKHDVDGSEYYLFPKPHRIWEATFIRGYPQFTFSDKKKYGYVRFQRSAYITYWMIENKQEKPDDKVLHHRCSCKKLCIEPSHLELMPRSQHKIEHLKITNVLDPSRKNQKTTLRDVDLYRLLHLMGYSIEELLNVNGNVLSKREMYAIVNFKRWRVGVIYENLRYKAI